MNEQGEGSENREYAPLHHLGKGRTNPRSRREAGNIWVKAERGEEDRKEGGEKKVERRKSISIEEMKERNSMGSHT